MTRVLLVEDEAAIRDAYAYLLRAGGFDVVEAPDGATARRRAADTTPDVVVLDLLLPDEDGIALCRALRAGSGDCLPILVLTVRSGREAHERVLAAGADEVMTKPAAADVLIGRLHALLAAASERCT